jgi:putative toxin-antitoxin system antitoxin component (TIGR02293 family)
MVEVLWLKTMSHLAQSEFYGIRKRGNGAPLSSEASEKLLRAARVRNLGRTLFTTDGAVSEWLSKPDASLGNMAPLDLLDTDLGAREVENLLRALAYGHFV